MYKKLTDRRLDLYFSLSKHQRKEINEIVHHHNIENISIDDFKRITSSKKKLKELIRLKQAVGLRLVA